ncbi:ATP-dependent helicase [Planctopirus hydrillae]|uniref:DNA 3'-5' helicase n=1 Tax=Planctopirus hydrillae TaxID=1841610 RepID=A0A1C3E5Q8_9PLAN|nr:UvrD-helicase domain-containing protein [Planctopirus hydrillae]ODA28574.1 AAA family ATPase [Planctopirus hydrillae]
MLDISHLNRPQQEAVRTHRGPLLVLAGAGTGKTRVITYRMADLIAAGVDPERILSVTFTNKAAREMLDRTSLLLGRTMKKRPTISTFHSWCVGILRQEIDSLGYPKQFVIYDRGDQESAARKALQVLKMTDTALKPGDLLAQISRWKMQGVMPDLAQEIADSDHEQLAGMAYRRYQLALKAAGGVDFDDLLFLTWQLFKHHPEALERQQNRFDFVQIDEYQDTNELQFRLIESIVRRHQNLCVVGDDDQSIYGWRGAEVKHILGFKHSFPAAKVVRLEDNYRCTESIIQLANQLVAHNHGRHEKRLIAHRGGTSVVFREYPDEQAEAEGVVRDIAYLIHQLNVRPCEIAILFRTNEQPRIFEHELRRKQIHYRIVGGQSFFDRKEIKDLQAYLKVLVNPRDDLSLLRIINVPPRGIGDATCERLLARAVKEKRRFWDVIPDAAAAGEITSKALNNLRQFEQQMSSLREAFKQPGVKLSETFLRMVETTGYAREIERTYRSAEQQEMRNLILGEFANAVSQYEAQSRSPSLEGYLDEVSLGGSDFAAPERPDENAITLMTLHSAKGLEFERVYLVGLEEGILPHKRSVDEEFENPSSVEEERRLCYVGITRAKDFLTITRSQSRVKWGKKRETKPSRFLKEMRTAMETIAAREGAGNDPAARSGKTGGGRTGQPAPHGEML